MTDTVKLRFVEAGRGTPVVLLHGFPLSGAIWRAQLASLSTEYRVIVPDLRGHGGSPVPAGAYTMDLLAGDVLALLDALGIDKAAILGHSMGGYAVLAAHRLAPQRFLALGMVASQAGADTDEGRQGRLKLAEKVLAEGSQAAADAMMPKVFAEPVPADASLAATVRGLMLATTPASIASSLHGLAQRPDSFPSLGAVRVPALVIAGAADRIIPLAKAEAMAAGIAGAQLVKIEGAGHMPMLEQPEATTAAIRGLLGRIG